MRRRVSCSLVSSGTAWCSNYRSQGVAVGLYRLTVAEPSIVKQCALVLSLSKDALMVLQAHHERDVWRSGKALEPVNNALVQPSSGRTGVAARQGNRGYSSASATPAGSLTVAGAERLLRVLAQ